MARELDMVFRSMGSDVRLLVGPPATGELPSAEEAARRTRDYIEYFARCLTRFDASSELCALNRDGRRAVPASCLVRAAVTAGVYGARRSGGLVDPTLIRPLERAGYASSRDGAVPVSLAEALEQAPPRRPAAPDLRAAWRDIEVDDGAGLVRRPPGLLFDTGGIGKGLAAEAAAQRLAGYPRLVVDCGGDIALRGEWEIQVEHPLTGECVRTLRLQRLRRRDFRPQRARLAARGRELRAPSDRPVDGRAGLDGPDRRHRGRANRARRRDPVEARAALGSRRRADRARGIRRDRCAR